MKNGKIYDLVVRRFLAVLYPPFEYEQTTVKAGCEEEEFLAKGKIVLKKAGKRLMREAGQMKRMRNKKESLL